MGRVRDGGTLSQDVQDGRAQHRGLQQPRARGAVAGRAVPAHHADGLYVLLKSGGGITVTANGLELTTISTPVRGTFTNSDLSTGVLTIAHLKALSAPYTVSVTIFNNSGVQVIPDSVTGTTNNVAVDLTSYGSLVGTWGYVVL